ncbi:hypothetical protein FSP39_003219 [Pinctada imbricata]|uniref:Chorion peroxidase n=1 Tax=Pinctada imbricata TaxID=66713 RepID=A0AA89C2V0_PINIB|nr:hypothetical protein FSP39_003219 [Pinctada imbricata]
MRTYSYRPIIIEASENPLFSSKTSNLPPSSASTPDLQLFFSRVTKVPFTFMETSEIQSSSSSYHYSSSGHIDERTEISLTHSAIPTKNNDPLRNMGYLGSQNSDYFPERNRYKVKSNQNDIPDQGNGFNFLTFLKSLASQRTIIKQEPDDKTRGYINRKFDSRKVKVDLNTNSGYEDPESYGEALTNSIDSTLGKEESPGSNGNATKNDSYSPKLRSDKSLGTIPLFLKGNTFEDSNFSNRIKTGTGKGKPVVKSLLKDYRKISVISGNGGKKDQNKQNLTNANSTDSAKSASMEYITGKYSRGNDLENTSNKSDLMTFSSGYLKSFQRLVSNSKLKRPVDQDIMGDMWLLWNQEVQHFCTVQRTYNCYPDYPYRTIDGSCNNLDHPDWGQSFQPQRRLLPPAYDDVLNAPRTKGQDGHQLPDVRELSNWLFRSNDKPRHHPNHTVMVMAWGQFLDHDMVSTPLSKEEDGSKIDCCLNSENREECFPIKIPADDGYFRNKSCMNFVRSAAAVQCMPAIREQVNAVTSYIDASNVYGSTSEEMWALREGTGGMLKVSRGNLLPKWEDTKCDLRSPHLGTFCMLAGDKRANVVPNLSALHIAFVREHNRIAKKLAEVNPDWSGDDEKLFQEARKIVGAYMQHITYDEYLPTVLNRDTLGKFFLNIKNDSDPNVYYSKTDASITNAFAAASFRFGHSQISSHQGFMNRIGNMTKVLPIEDCYNNPELLEKEDCKHSCPRIARWMTTDTCTMADSTFETGVRDKLFMDKHGKSFDLPAINIQRGRDHGIPSYNTWRKFLGLTEIKSFDPDKSYGLVNHYPHTASILSQVYRHVDDIDLYVGAMTERHMEGASVGPTFDRLIADQFRTLKEGDRFWFENNQFSREQIRSIKEVKLAKILCQNMEVENIQPQVMFIPNQSRCFCRIRIQEDYKREGRSFKRESLTGLTSLRLSRALGTISRSWSEH